MAYTEKRASSTNDIGIKFGLRKHIWSLSGLEMGRCIVTRKTEKYTDFRIFKSFLNPKTFYQINEYMYSTCE